MARAAVRPPGFWQQLAAAELSPGKQRVVLESLGDPWPDLTAAERGRVDSASLEDARRAFANGIRVWTTDEPERPPFLFVRGDATALDRPCIAIVGTRGASAYGKAAAFEFGRTFAAAGITVVSGGAYGIDAEAHRGALDANGRTIAIVGCGADVNYPDRNAQLFTKMTERGGVASVYPCGAAQLAHWLPARNKVVARTCLGVVVVEAPHESGALITAAAAIRLERPVFVVPGPYQSETFRGSHALVREGAVLADDPRQVLDACGLSGHGAEIKPVPSGPAGAVFLSLCGEPLSPEAIGRSTGLEASEVLAALTLLEVEGRVRRLGAGYALLK